MSTQSILADRGFGRAEWAAIWQELGFGYLVRIKPAVTVAGAVPRRCSRYPVRKGMAHGLRDVQYRRDGRVTHHVVIRWRPGLPKERDEPWYLMTDLDGRAEALCRLGARRMSVEELFRDHKSRRDGLAPRDTRIQEVERFDRLLLVLASVPRGMPSALPRPLDLGHLYNRYFSRVDRNPESSPFQRSVIESTSRPSRIAP